MTTHAQKTRAKVTETNFRPSARPSYSPSFLVLLAMIATLTAAIGLSSCAGYTTNAASAGSQSTQTTQSSSGTGVLSANTTSVDFGSVAVGSNATQTVTLADTGTGSVTISSVSVSGTGFSVLGGGFSGTVTAGQSVNVQVQFAPELAGSNTGSVIVVSGASSSITSNAVSSGVTANASSKNPSVKILLHGNATQGDISLSPSSVSFSNVTVGQSSTQSVALTNNGTANLQIKNAPVAGNGFSTTGLTLPLTLPAGHTTSFAIHYAPTSAGSSSGSIAFADNAPLSPQTFVLTGNAVAAGGTLSANPGSYNFNNVLVGSNGKETITLTNSGSGTVTINQVSASGAGFSASGISAGQTIAAGAQASFIATFAPASAGAASGTITISTNATNPTVSIALGGNGTQGALSADPSSINFGGVLVGSNGSATVTLINSGTAPVSVSAASASGTGFTVSGFTAGTLNPGSTSSFTVTFAPAAAGNAAGTVSVVSNAPGPPLTIGLSGSATATQPQLSVSPSSLAFSNVNVGSNASQTVTLTNKGTAALNITGATISGSGYTMTAAPTTINAGASASFSVTFTPAAEGSATGSVYITSNALPSTIALNGTGMQALGSASPASVSFGSVVVGNSNSSVITLKNTGNATLSFSQVSVSGSGFSISGLTTSSTIPAGGSLNFNAVFTPTAVASSSASITLATNGSPAQISIPLTGSGATATESLSLSPSSLNFGNVQVGSNNSLTTTLTNNGNSNVSISGMSVSGADYTTTGLASGMTLTPNQSVTLTITFAPTALGSDPETMSIASNATSPTTISLTGESHTVLLKWTASTSSGVTGYYVYRETQSGQYAKINPSAASGTQFTDTTVAAATTYNYAVTAVDSSGTEGPYSSPATVSVP